MKTLQIIFTAMLLAVPTLHAQLVADGGTNTLSNVTTNITGDVTVGTNGSFTLLVLSDNALLTNSVNGIIGLNSTARSNEVRLASASARWLIGNDFYVGSNGAFNTLVVSNGAQLVANNDGIIGDQVSGSNNTALVTGAGSTWSNVNTLFVGNSGSGNRLVVGNGGLVLNVFGFGDLGQTFGSSNNEATVTGEGSFWDMPNTGIFVGNQGSGNRLVVSNGGAVRTYSGYIGFSAGTNNEVLVTGAGSIWTNLNFIFVGNSPPRNRLTVTNGGVVCAFAGIVVGTVSSSTNNRIVVDGGTLRATEYDSSALDVRRGTNVFNAGLIEVNQLLLTNALSRFEFNGGTLCAKNSRVSIGPPLVIGNGVSPATFILAGNGTHDFSGTLGLIVSSNATLSGNGSLIVQLQVRAGAQIAPGASVGKISLSTPPFFSGTILMEISKNGAVLTNDQIQVTGTLTYGGSLIVSNLGPTALAIGDRFPLFSANSYAGAFSGFNLPNPGPGLNWTNKLLMDGSIEVVTWSGPKIGSVTVSDTNLTFSVTEGFPGGAYDVLTATNIATPLTNWIIASSGTFDWLGNATVTNGIAPGEPVRFYRIHTL